MRPFSAMVNCPSKANYLKVPKDSSKGCPWLQLLFLKGKVNARMIWPQD